MFLVDSHCHLDGLDYQTLHKNVDDVLAKAAARDVKFCLASPPRRAHPGLTGARRRRRRRCHAFLPARAYCGSQVLDGLDYQTLHKNVDDVLAKAAARDVKFCLAVATTLIIQTIKMAVGVD
jgi:Tat protein secretion system quality control protein TatD with DNase activity